MRCWIAGTSSEGLLHVTVPSGEGGLVSRLGLEDEGIRAEPLQRLPVVITGTQEGTGLLLRRVSGLRHTGGALLMVGITIG